jgi:hypothetical protein
MTGRACDWDFPLPRTHTGILQGNGTMGAMVWGEGSVLRITIGRADLWDHRGGMPWTEKMSYANIRACLEAKDEKGLRELFERTQNAPGEPARPSVIPIGRVEIDFGTGSELLHGQLDLDTGKASIQVLRKGRTRRLRIALSMRDPVMCVSFEGGLKPEAVRHVTAWDYVGETLKSISFPAARQIPDGDLGGWVQELPADPPICVGYRQQGSALYIATARGNGVEGSVQQAKQTINAASKAGFERLQARNAKWWADYWKGVPHIDVPNERVSFMYDYGMYKFAGLTNPEGVAATLQGPWIEEYQMPPWCSDYHFNINVQLCYQPAYHGNRLEHLKPLWALIASWQETLRHNAKVFLGIDDGVMLPHAVDDRCTCMGGFWTGSVDHGCTAWVALMMFRYYRYTMDGSFLRDTAWPFMRGAMRVYEGMLEKDSDTFVLPVSVSPEYRGASMNAWGRNASFQLACVHALAEALIQAADQLGQAPDPIWPEILEKLPKACLTGDPARPEIALWEGTPLEESHRHHSHLGGIAPFDIFDLEDEKWQPILERSIAKWIYRGPGLWSGWCVPWAAMIHTRFGNAEMAETLIEATKRFFTNEGHGTLHDANVPGFTLMGIRATGKHHNRKEIMQMDAGMAATAAVQEMMLHVRRGVNILFAGAPREWKHVRFGPMRTDGGFLVSAERERGVVAQVKVQSPFGGVLRLKNPWDGPATVRRKGKATALAGKILEVATKRGDRLTLTRGN